MTEETEDAMDAEAFRKAKAEDDGSRHPWREVMAKIEAQDSPPTQEPDHAVEAGRVDAESGKSNEMKRAGHILAMRLLQSDVHLDDAEINAINVFVMPPAEAPATNPATNVSGTEGSQGKGTELLPCPFCGDEPEIENGYTYCASRGCCIRYARMTPEYWNRRSPSPQPQASGQLEQIAREITEDIGVSFAAQLNLVQLEYIEKQIILKTLSRAAVPVSPQASAETEGEKPVQLTEKHKELIVEWARGAESGKRYPNGATGDDVWKNEEARRINLETFARSILSSGVSVPIGEKEGEGDSL